MTFDKQNITTELAKNFIEINMSLLNHCVKFNHLSKKNGPGQTLPSPPLQNDEKEKIN